jgi:hypothetical protein
MAVLALAACSSGGTGPNPAGSAVPISDLGPQDYLGRFEGGLYPGGVNTMPAGHAAVGQARAANIQPRAGNGSPTPSGKYVLLSVGMSHATQEWCAKNGNHVQQLVVQREGSRGCGGQPRDVGRRQRRRRQPDGAVLGLAR